MATLHVRNVPDALYELLRDAAEREGRSIGAQALVYVQQGLVPHASRRAFPRRRRSGGFQRFESGAREVVAKAQDEARAVGATHVRPAHLVLALLERDPLAREALGSLGIEAAAVRAGLEHGPGSPAQIAFAPETKKALEVALRESLALRRDSIGTEHLLLALSADPLFDAAGGEGAVRAAVTLAAAHPGRAAPLPRDDRDYLAVDLGGDASDWTDQLNELAAEGWELMQVLDRRAVLRRGS